MIALKKRRLPANDLLPEKTPWISYVVLPRVTWDKKKIVIAAMLGVFVFILSAIWVTVHAPVVTEVALKSTASAPFDITLNSNAPAIQDDETGDRYFPLSYKALPPVLEVEVKDGSEAHASVAQDYMRRGDMAAAIRYQHRAVELAPANMLLRLKLAIMYDRVSDREGAAMLYRQVIEAYGKHDKTLPRKFDVDGIRNRLSYLSPTAEK
jgi:hypothetical protein